MHDYEREQRMMDTTRSLDKSAEKEPSGFGGFRRRDITARATHRCLDGLPCWHDEEDETCAKFIGPKMADEP